MNKGAELVVRTVKAVEAGNYPQTPQPHDEELKAAPKIFKETCEIQWNQPTESVRNFIRGLAPYPAAWTTLNGKLCKIYKSSVATQIPTDNGSQLFTDNKHVLLFKTADGWLSIDELQLEGKKRMGVEEFLRGTKLTMGQ